MVAALALVSSLVAAASTVQAGLIPHHHRALTFARSAVPEGWITAIMEPYDAYHSRYMALDCEDKHNTAFFDLCCHPMKSNETLATARDASCDPANLSTAVASATATSSAPAASNVATSGDDDDEDCDEDDGDDGDDEDDCDDDGETSSVPAATSVHTSKAAASTKAAATSSAIVAKPTTTKAAKPTTTSAAPATSSAAETTSEAAPTTTKKATSTKAATSAKPTSSASSGDDGGDWIEGGKATFFLQEGGLGSCGNANSDSTPLVAVDVARMKSSLCGKHVEIINTANNKKVTAIIQDTCPGCPNGNSLDLSTGAFDAIGDEATGVLDIKWKLLDY